MDTYRLSTLRAANAALCARQRAVYLASILALAASSLPSTFLWASPPFVGNVVHLDQSSLLPGNTVADDEKFGSTVASGDFDNDGFDDLAIGEPFADVDGDPAKGLVHVFFSAGASGSFEQPAVLTPGPLVTEVFFGAALAVGDFNQDGIDDLAVGAPGFDLLGRPGAGRVFVYRGGNGGFGAQEPGLNDPSSQTDVGFGSALVALPTGLAIGAPGTDFDLAGTAVVDGGIVYLANSTANGLTAVNSGFTQGSVGDFVEDGDRFGEVLVAGDFDGDGDTEIAVGVPREAVQGVIDAGAVSIFDPSARRGGGSSSTFSQVQAGSLLEADDRFGSSLVVADFDGDGEDELGIGVPGEDIDGHLDAGLVQVVPGSPTGLQPFMTSGFTQSGSVGGVVEADDRFGAALIAGDFDLDGFVDLVAGSPGQDMNLTMTSGMFVLLPGSQTGINGSSPRLFRQSSFGLLEENGDEFASVLGVGDFNGDGAADLVVGTPLEDVAAADDGAVLVLFSEGLFADGFESGDTSAWSFSTP